MSEHTPFVVRYIFRLVTAPFRKFLQARRDMILHISKQHRLDQHFDDQHFDDQLCVQFSVTKEYFSSDLRLLVKLFWSFSKIAN